MTVRKYDRAAGRKWDGKAAARKRDAYAVAEDDNVEVRNKDGEAEAEEDKASASKRDEEAAAEEDKAVVRKRDEGTAAETEGMGFYCLKCVNSYIVVVLLVIYDLLNKLILVVRLGVVKLCWLCIGHGLLVVY